MAQPTTRHPRGPNARRRTLVGATLGLTIAAALLAASPAAADETPNPDSSTALTVSAFADPSSGLTGDCVGVALDVAGVSGGVALLPIIASLVGPLDSVAEGTTASGPTIGSIEATWGGTEWSYSGNCVTVPAAGSYAWTLNDTNSSTGIDDLVHSAATVTIQNPAPTVPTDPGTGGDDGSVEPLSVDDSPKLANTGISAESVAKLALAGAFLLLIGLGIAIVDLFLYRGEKARAAFATHTEEKK